MRAQAQNRTSRVLSGGGHRLTLGVASFVAASLAHVESRLAANTVLFCRASGCHGGRRFYYQQAESKGVVLGLFMFAVVARWTRSSLPPNRAGRCPRPTATPASGSSEPRRVRRSHCTGCANRLQGHPQRYACPAATNHGNTEPQPENGNSQSMVRGHCEHRHHRRRVLALPELADTIDRTGMGSRGSTFGPFFGTGSTRERGAYDMRDAASALVERGGALGELCSTGRPHLGQPGSQSQAAAAHPAPRRPKLTIKARRRQGLRPPLRMAARARQGLTGTATPPAARSIGQG